MHENILNKIEELKTIIEQLANRNNVETPSETPSEEYPDIKVYTIELEKFNINNENVNATETTKGINEALIYAKENGYKKVVLPKGHYAIDTSVKNPIVLTDGTNKWTHNRQGISMQSDMELILEGAILEMVPCEDPYYSILTISNCTNSKITGGTILGDRDTHDYGMRINNDGDMLESGGFDDSGNPVSNDSQVRTKNFIYVYEDWFTGQEENLPSKFYIIPLWNTSKNTVDGGCRFIYCYDNNGKYLGMANGGNGFIKQAILKEGTSKIKIAFKNEQRLDATYAMTKRSLYYTYEFGVGITIADSNNIEISRTIIKDCIGDSICTVAPPLKVTVDNLKIIDCTLENSRRQGISFVATGENYLVKGCNIGKINGTDPQCGIDFEHYDYVRNVVIDGVNFYDNKKWDIINYNGTDIEVKNSKFTGAISTTSGHTMDIHNNYFEYKDTPNDDKIFKQILINLATKNNKVYNNTFKNGTVTNSGENCETYNNIFTDCNVTIWTNGINRYYNCKVGIKQNTDFPILSNNYFENSDVYCHNDSPKIEIIDCEFKNSSFNGRGLCIVKNTIFNLEDKYLLGGWKSASTDITFENCEINSKLMFLQSGLNAKLTFRKSNIVTPRETIVQYGITTFEDSKITFSQDGNEKDFVWNIGGYGYERCPWYFHNCIIESELPIKIYNCATNSYL